MFSNSLIGKYSTAGEPAKSPDFTPLYLFRGFLVDGVYQASTSSLSRPQPKITTTILALMQDNLNSLLVKFKKSIAGRYLRTEAILNIDDIWTKLQYISLNAIQNRVSHIFGYDIYLTLKSTLYFIITMYKGYLYLLRNLAKLNALSESLYYFCFIECSCLSWLQDPWSFNLTFKKALGQSNYNAILCSFMTSEFFNLTCFYSSTAWFRHEPFFITLELVQKFPLISLLWITNLRFFFTLISKEVANI